ncbi:S-layer homology domain-containing protein, partial [Oscillibacter sp.]|uniref:S-layer homology domain-containing protein n=1 Tax=Oscillibacter sp. TaxID=1945593 RepID=UPI0033980F74
YTVSTNVFTRTNYTFTGWNTEADGKGTPYAVGAPLIGGPGSDDILLYAQWSPTGGGSNPGSTGGGGGGVSTPTTTAPTASGATATTTVTAQTGTNGTATASVTQSQVTSAIEKAQAAAKSSGEAPSVEIHVSGGSNANAVQTTIPKAAVQAMVSGKMDSLTLSGPVAAMTFDAQAISAIAGAASGDVAFASSKVDNSSLSNAARQTVGNHPVYNFSVTSGGSTISQFGGAVTVSVPYTPAAGENPDAIVAYYINANGEPELMQNCHYDAQTGTLVFTTTHFSTYAVGYHKVAFSDVAEDAWCYDAVTFLAARGITGGTTETAFNPNATLTRGQFITLVMRAYGIEPDESAADNFSDAGDTYYTGYLAAAKRLGISNGVGGNKFAPKQAVSRQQMFTLLYNALKAIDQLPEEDSGKMLADFTDSANISSYAQEAMASLVESGAVSGSNGNLRPTATTTRAQMAQVLYNLLRK